MNSWDRLFLSPEFLIVAFLGVVVLLFLLLKIIDVINNYKSRKHLENLAFFFSEQGDTAMKNLLDTLSSAVSEAEKAPLGAHNTARHENLAAAVKRTMAQGDQVGSLLGQLAVLNGVNKAGAELKDINDALEGNVAGAQKAFNESTPTYLQATLAAQEELQQIAAPSEVTPPVEASPEPVSDMPAATDDASPAADGSEVEQNAHHNTGEVVSINRGQQEQEMSADDVRAAIQAMPYLHSIFTGAGVNQNNGWTWDSLPNHAIDQLLAHFRGKAATIDGTSEEKSIFKFLGGLKNHRNEAKMHKTGSWFFSSYKGLQETVVLFFCFSFDKYDII